MGASPSTASQIQGGELVSSINEFFKDFKLESKIISQETITLIQSHLENGDLQCAISTISDALRDTENVPLNIAVIGEPGSGKTTFINALQGIGQDEGQTPHAWPVEGILERTKYTFYKKFPNVILWDLPTMGATQLPLHTYLQKMKFGEYDLFIIISALRIKENDLRLAAEIKKMKKNFYFVQTKVDLGLYHLKISTPRTLNKDKFLQSIRNDCMYYLQEANMGDTQIFLISSLQLSDYDFQSLETTLLREIPAYKHNIFMQYLSKIVEVAIDQKRDSLKQKVWLEALKAGASATIPFMGLISNNEVEKLEKTLNFYRSYFGLDDESLETIAKDLRMSVEKLKSNLMSPHLLSVEKDDESLSKKLLRYVEKFCSVSGGPVATGIYFRKIYYLQNYFLDSVANDAKVLLRRDF